MNRRLDKIGERFLEELVKAMPNFRKGWLVVIAITGFPLIVLWAFINWVFIETDLDTPNI